MTLHSPDTTIAARRLTRTTPEGFYIADACLVHLSGNDRPYFSLTGEHWPSAAAARLGLDRDCLGSGAMGDTLADVFADDPGVALLNALHLADDDGVPTHAAENGFYWFTGADRVRYGEPAPGTDADAAAKTANYLRCSITDLPPWVQDMSGFDPDEVAGYMAEHRATFEAFVDTLREGWKADAARALAWLEQDDDASEPDDTDAGPLANVRLSLVEGPYWGRDEDGWEHNRYKLQLRYQGRTMAVTWRAGLGIDGRPDVADVLGSVLSDAAGYDNAGGFEDWAADYGYDVEDEGETAARKVYAAVARQTESLARLLGDDYDAAVFPNG